MFEMIIGGYRWFFLQMASVLGPGWAIVALSFICSFLMLPLMRAVAGIVRRETDYQSVIDPQVAAIKAKYTSDMDRHLHIQRLYARYGYSPLAPVKKVLPLFVQIPFLLLTYYMLKGTAELSGVKFLFLNNLGEPDSILHLRLLPSPVNLLPLVMTGVNIVTVFATPSFTKKDWTQAIAIALLFLVLLYNAPSALLLYWTLNNVITMVRTLSEKNFSGAKLFLPRLNPLRYFRWINSRPQSFWAVVVLFFFVLVVYFYAASMMMMGVLSGICMNVMYRGVVFVIAMASIGSAILLFRDRFVIRRVLILSTIAIVSFACGFAVIYAVSRVKFMEFMQIVDLFVVAKVLVGLWALPYVFQHDGACIRTLPHDMVLAFKKNVHLYVLPLVFAVHYAYSSKAFALSFSSLAMFVIYLEIAPIVLGAALVFLFRRWLDVDLLVKSAVGACCAVYLIPMFSYGDGVLSGENNILVRIGILIAVPLLMMRFAKQKASMTFFVILLIAAIVNAVVHQSKDTVPPRSESASHDERMRKVVGDAHCIKSNNVYLVVFDSYAHQAVMDGLHLQDHKIYDLLREKSFTLYDAYSCAGDTIQSMSRVFEIGGVMGGSRRSTIAGDNIFSDFLRTAGYKTFCFLNGYVMPNRGERMPADYYFPQSADIACPEKVLFACIMRGVMSQSPQVFNSYTHEGWLERFHNVVSNVTNRGNFIYAHSSYPEHANWFPRDRKTDNEEQAKYRKRLEIANKEIVDSIRLVTEDPEAIVIFASDHGASLLIPDPPGAWDARHLIDHFGVLLAVRWPNDYKPCLKLNCIQNVLLEVMIYLSECTELARLEKERATIALEYPLLVPAAAVSRGIIQCGPDAGRSLFDAARDAFGRRNENGR